MRCEILKSFLGSPDGGTVISYTEGETVEMADSLAEVALKEKWARPARETAAHAAAPETKPATPKATKGSKK